MPVIDVYDPPMCCPTGVCGVDVDPVLIRFAADLKWLQEQKVEVYRYNLAQQPGKFVECKAVKQSMSLAGELCLPLILVDGSIAFRNKYPSRGELAEAAGISAE